MTRTTPFVRTGLFLLAVLASAGPAFAMGQWPEPTLDEAAKDTLTSFEGTITGYNLESEPPVLRLVSKFTGKTYVFAMDHRTTSVWFEEKLRRLRFLQMGDEIKMFFVVRDRKGLITSIEVLKRAPKAKPASEGNLMDDLKALKKRPPPAKAPAPVMVPRGPASGGAPSTPAPMVVPRPPMPTTTTERRVH